MKLSHGHCQKLDYIIQLILCKRPFSVFNYKEFSALSISKEEYQELLFILSESFKSELNFELGIGSSFWVSNTIPLKLFLDQGGFTNHFQKSISSKTQIEQRQQLEIEQMKLQIKALQDAPSKEKKIMLWSKLAVVISILALLSPIIIWVIEHFYLKSKT